MSLFQPIIGLEVHIELKTKSKMFCGCSADHFGKKPNTQVCPVCLGLPGSLPVINQKAVEMTVLTGLALNCKLSPFSKFDRKNYFYPDLPKGYQISQYDLPFAQQGQLRFRLQEGRLKTIRIRRVHLEEDTAKMIHAPKATLLDFNRAGVPLMEIVTEPDLNSAQEAKEFLKELQQIVRYLEVSEAEMEKGTMRCEANVSIKVSKWPTYKVEIKNLNSFRFVEKAINYEIERQIKLFQKGKQPSQETRGWEETKQITYPQRLKEEAQDYRYFPEPDLPPIRWSKSQIAKFNSQIAKIELPQEKRERFQKQYHLSQYQAKILTETKAKADYFEQAVKLGKRNQISAQEIAKVIINKKIDFTQFSPQQLVKAWQKQKKKAKISLSQLKKLVQKALKNNPQAVTDYQKGKLQAIEFLVGQVVREISGRIDIAQLRTLIKKEIKTKSSRD